MTVRSLWWEDGALHLVDQTRLPDRVEEVVCRTWEEVADAIRTMRIRGAPAIGAAGAYGLVLAAAAGPASLARAAEGLRRARPTAVNLGWAIDRMLHAARGAGGDLVAVLRREADAIAAEDVAANRRIGELGAALLPEGARVLTYCNTGALATVDYGTAFGVLRVAHEQGRRIAVYACETRPFLQGARLTAFELLQHGIPATLITDNAAASLMQRGTIDAVIVGADRVAANGDVANKIGTYGLAVLAHHHRIPFYVAAPRSTIDPATASGAGIPIEERSPDEVTHVGGRRIAPEGIAALHPAFDVTPADLVTAIITEAGVARAPYGESLARLLSETAASR